MAAGSFDVLLLHLLLIWWTRSHPLVANHNDDGRRRLEQWRSNRLGFAINSPICRKRKAETLRSKRFGNRSPIAGVAAQFRPTVCVPYECFAGAEVRYGDSAALPPATSC